LGNQPGSVNPTRSKAKQGIRGGPPRCLMALFPGRPLEAAGNRCPRCMAAAPKWAQNPAYSLPSPATILLRNARCLLTKELITCHLLLLLWQACAHCTWQAAGSSHTASRSARQCRWQPAFLRPALSRFWQVSCSPLCSVSRVGCEFSTTNLLGAVPRPQRELSLHVSIA